MTDIKQRLRALVILDEVRSDNSLGRDAADEIERLEHVIEDAIDTLESMDLYIGNPLYNRLIAALDGDQTTPSTRHE